MRIYLLGYFHAGAYADDLIELATADLLREALPGCQLLDAASAPHPRSGPEVAEFFNDRADCVLFCGGSLLGRLRLAPFDNLETWIDRLRVPLVLFGPGWRAESRPLADAEIARMTLLLDRAAAVYVRGELSAARLRQLTARPVLAVGDPGLCYRAEGSGFRVQGSGSRKQGVGQVGVVVREISSVEIRQDARTVPNERFHRRLAELLDWLVDEEGAEVCFFSMAAPGRSHDNDAAGAERVRRLMRHGLACGLYGGADPTPRGVARCLGRTDLVISQRLHGTLVSIAAGVPVVPIEYQFGKMADALSVSGFERLRQLITPAAVFGVQAWAEAGRQLQDPELVAAGRAAAAAVRERYLELARALPAAP